MTSDPGSPHLRRDAEGILETTITIGTHVAISHHPLRNPIDHGIPGNLGSKVSRRVNVAGDVRDVALGRSRIVTSDRSVCAWLRERPKSRERRQATRRFKCDHAFAPRPNVPETTSTGLTDLSEVCDNELSRD